jgi:hypothetical protein
MSARDFDTSTTPAATAAVIGQRRGTWAQWGRHRRRLVALTVANRVALAGWFVVAIAFEEVRIPLLAIAMPASLGLDFWLRRRLQEAEEAEGAFDVDESSVAATDELELLERLEGAGGARRAAMLAGAEVLSGTPVARRYAFPTRELLVVHSVSEAIELLGVMIVVLTAPAPAGIALGAVMWLLGGRAGTATAKLAFGQRLYRSAVDDATRERWLGREGRMIVGGYLTVLLIVLLRLT